MVIIILKKRKKASNIQQKIQRSELFFRKWEQNARKYQNRPNVSSKLVSPGDQAVDNQIKAEAGQLLKRGNQEVTFVSHDRGFDKYKNRKNDRSSGNRITTVKSVKDKLK